LNPPGREGARPPREGAFELKEGSDTTSPKKNQRPEDEDPL
jgi:hypothetical protein